MVSATLEPVCVRVMVGVRRYGSPGLWFVLQDPLGGSAKYRLQGVPCGQETFYVLAALYWPVGQLVQPESQSESQSENVYWLQPSQPSSQSQSQP